MHFKRGDTGTSPKAYGRVPGQRGDKIPDSVEPVLDSYWQSGIRAIRHRSGVLSVMGMFRQSPERYIGKLYARNAAAVLEYVFRDLEAL